ncbi:MAG: alanine--tRNA ligase [Pirellulales bacterium]|nr:alanine--tRNA ligase [Pirellulales bacterium]
MNTNELREKYLDFFETKGCVRRPSDVLVPTWDPSVLFTPAGMNQFKDHFLGKCKLEFTRATTCQKCLRTGDIENVGRTAYHHTFFEMLGNFSFGDYFKRDAINWAWEFLTEKKWLGLDPDRLSVTVYLDDDEAADIWASDIKLTPDRIERLDEDENFWPASAPSQGPDGVCGPCSEIFYHDDKGESVEIWNLVFTQFNRVGDPPNNLRPLPSKNIDTGMGLERTAATLQGVDTNFHIDILRPIVDAAAEVCGVKYAFETEDGRRLRRITDHVRACAMAVHENVYPGAQKEKYVIRRLLRRAVLDGHQLGQRDAFLCKLVPAVVEQMKAAYPDIAETTERVASVIKQEEESFFGTIDAGLERIDGIFKRMQQDKRPAVDGREAADLYQTYGVPPELFESIAAEHNLAFDWDGFHKAMEEHGLASGTVKHNVMGGAGGPIDAIKRAMHEVEFCGYDTTECDATLKFIVAQGQLCDRLEDVSQDNIVTVVLDKSPFYGESGGQVGDQGQIRGEGFLFRVTDTQKDGSLVLHQGHLVQGTMQAETKVTATVDAPTRDGIRRAHSATHILHFALQKELGQHAQQQGSKVDDDWLRFDFTNLSAVAPEQLETIQSEVDDRVAAADQVDWQVLPLAEARAAGAMMLFGEKYPDPVRMVSMGDFSRELCGGTHLDNTSEVAAFEILTEEAVSAGTRRITALTGTKAKEHQQQTRDALETVAKLLDVTMASVPVAAKSLAERVRGLKKQVSGGAKQSTAEEQGAQIKDNPEPSYAEIKAALRATARSLNVGPFEVPARIEALLADAASLEEQLATASAAGAVTADDLLESATPLDDTKIVVADIAGGNPNTIRQLIDQIRKKSNSAAVLLAAAQGDSKVMLVAGLTPDLVGRGASAGDWVRETAKIVGGSGGGRPDMAQAGGKNPSQLPKALDEARAQIERMLTN